jgi:glycosyltransferase involved in cell wall biosynthesis
MIYSVIIPTYNRRDLLVEAINSVFQQHYPAIEIIVIDDGSTDGTAQMIADKFPSVRYFYQPNQGPSAARNRGILESKGELIAFLDSDDIWLANKIDIELALLQEFPQAALLAGNARAYIENKVRAQDTFAQRNIIFDQQQPTFFDWSMSIMQIGPVCCTSSMLLKKSALIQLGEKPFDEELRFDEDWDLEFRLFSRFEALLYPQIVCESRAFNDGTRLFYSAPGQKRSHEEQQTLWRQQKNIISRHLNNPYWSMETEGLFRSRHKELTALIMATSPITTRSRTWI